MAEVRMFIDHLEKYSATVDDAQRQAPPVSQALSEIARDRPARARYLEFMRDADQASVRARMIALAERFGWLTPEQKHAELVRMVGDRLARRDIGSADVDLVCTLNRDHALDDALGTLQPEQTALRDVGSAAVLACLGSAAGHARVLLALTSRNDADVLIAQAYLHQRPIADVNELRQVASGVARMQNADAQVRALDTLARHRLSDRETLELLTRLFPATRSLDVQRAIAGILIRADYQALAAPELVRSLREHRVKSPAGQDLIDILIRRLQANLSPAA
jgi:hypothetical protein